jgi:class 3 adenylate cyclase/uncharacterized protein (DUF427 family)
MIELAESTVNQAPVADYKISYEPHPQRVRVVFNGVTVADSTRTVIVHETRRPPVYYFPRADVDMAVLLATDRHSYCPFRGNASYWTLQVNGRQAENAVWSYPEPFSEAMIIQGYIAFFSDLMDGIYDGDAEVFFTARDDSAYGQLNPLIPWLLYDASELPSAQTLVHEFARHLLRVGVSLWWLRIGIRTLHPQLFSTNYGWRQDRDTVEAHQLGYGIFQDSRFLESPLIPILAGAGGVRRRLDIPNPQLDYPILHDLYAEGGTDYIVMPMIFSDGQINTISLASNQPGGFSTRLLGHIHEALPLLSRLFEVHAVRSNAVNLLETYLGRQSGSKVLNGLIKRGDGEDIYAVIWFCDLRDSTPLAESMSRAEFLLLLNEYFECMAGAVLDHGGEVLRFIGDAVLAIFPIVPPAAGAVDTLALKGAVCATALAAARDAAGRVERVNKERIKQHKTAFRYGIGLHIGNVMYGNIGTPGRLEFTVIGSAANEAARIESLCKTLGHKLLLSEEFARYCSDELIGLGGQELRGVRRTREVFTLPGESAA